MKPSSLKELKTELLLQKPEDWLQYCLKLAKFDKTNKEYLTYLLFDSGDEQGYIQRLKQETDQEFSGADLRTWYLTRKIIRKILRELKMKIRFSPRKETEVEVLLHFCALMKELRPSIHNNTRVQNIYFTQIGVIRRKIAMLHEDLKFDYTRELEQITKNDPVKVQHNATKSPRKRSS